MANMFKGIWPVGVIFLKIERWLAQNREGEANMAAVVEIIKQRNAQVFSRRIFWR